MKLTFDGVLVSVFQADIGWSVSFSVSSKVFASACGQKLSAWLAVGRSDFVLWVKHARRTHRLEKINRPNHELYVRALCSSNSNVLHFVKAVASSHRVLFVQIHIAQSAASNRVRAITNAGTT